MVREWSPSVLGRFINGSWKWHLRLAGQDMVLGLDGLEQRIPVEDLPLLEIRKGLFWGKLTLRQGYPDAVRVDGLPNRYVSALQSALQELLIGTRAPRFFVYYAGILKWLSGKPHNGSAKTAAILRGVVWAYISCAWTPLSHAFSKQTLHECPQFGKSSPA